MRRLRLIQQKDDGGENMKKKIFSSSEVDKILEEIAPPLLESYPIQFRKVTDESLSYHCDKVLEIENKRIFPIYPWIIGLHTSGLFYRANECVKGSILLAYGGYYNSALLLLRSVIELGCYIIYFKDHKVEYSWWKEKKDIGYKSFNELIENYLFRLDSFDKFTITKNDGKKENILKNAIKTTYTDISLVIHGRWKSDKNTLLLDYDEEQFQHWYHDFLKTIDIFNILILVGYWDKFENEGRAWIISSISNESLRGFIETDFR